MTPSWLKPGFLALHVAIGAAFAVVLHLLGSPPAATVVATLALAIGKEYGEEPSDFDPAFGGPWNGVLDVAAFVVVPAVWWAVA